MAKTYSFDEVFSQTDSSPKEPISSRSPKTFSFEDVFKMQPAAEPVAETTVAAPPAAETPVASEVTPEAAPVEEPTAGPAKTTSGLDIGAMPEQFKSGLAGMQQGFFANVGRNNAAILNVMDLIDRGEYVVPEKDVIGYQEMTPEQRAAYKDTFLRALGSNIEAYQEYKKEQEQYVRNTTADQFIKLADNDDYAGAWKAFKSDPLGIIQQLSVESLPNALPSIAGGVAGAALRSGISRAAIGAGTGSFPVEFMASIADSLAESGVNLKDPKAIEEMLRDQNFIEEAGKRAVTRGQVIGGAGAASTAMMSPLVAGNIFKNIGIAAGNLIKSLLGEGGGEAGAMAATGEEIKMGQVLAEMIGAGPQTVASTVTSTIAESRKPGEAATEAKVEPAVEPSVEPVAEPTTAEPEVSKYGYLELPEYKTNQAELEKNLAQWNALRAKRAELAEGSPEWNKSISDSNKFYDENVEPLNKKIEEIETNWLESQATKEAEPEVVAEEKPLTDQDVLWLDTAQMEKELADTEPAAEPAVAEPTISEEAQIPAEERVEPTLAAEPTEELKAGDTLTFEEATAPAAEKPVEEVKETPPKLIPPEDLKLKKGRNEQVVLAARELAAGNITKEQYDQYVDAYAPISTVPNPEPLLNQDSMFDILTTKLGKNNKKPEFVDAPIEDGARVGLRMDIPALEWGKANGENGSVVSIHEGRDPELKTQGKNISYKAAGVVDNPVFAVRSEERAFGIAQNLPGRAGEKTPQQTIEGTWVNMPPEQVYQEIQANLNNPEWTQVSLDPLRHSFFYDRATRQPVLSADRVLQAGRFVLAKNVKYGERENFLYNIETGKNPAYEGQKRSPSLKRAVSKLFERWQNGLMTSDELALSLEKALDATSKDRYQALPKRVRGADIIREKLLAAKRRGELSEEAVDLAEWFIRQNEDLVADLGLSIKAAKEDVGTSGFYNSVSRIFALIKGSDNTLTPVHEILHHLERMMPEKIRTAIRKEWSKSLLKAAEKADKGKDQNLKDYYTHLIDHHINEDPFALKKAKTLLMEGKVDYEHYQNFNPSEFWAINGSDIVNGRYEATRSVLARLKNWLRDFGQKIKSAFGLRSDAAIIRALDSLAKSDGKFVTSEMLGEGNVFENIPKNYKGQPAPAATFEVPKKTRITEAAYNLFNEQTYLKRVNEALERAYAVPAELNAYTKELLKNSRAAYRSKMFHLKEVRPILQLMKKLKISDAELSEYSQAKFAEQRNKQIADRGGSPDGGSGMFTADAQQILASIPAARLAQLEQVRQKMKDIITGTQNLYVTSGAETQNTINGWNNADNSEYVPLNRKDEDFAMGSSGLGGLGYSASGRSSKMATGSIDKDVKSILENIIHQRDVAIERAERMRVGRALYALAIKYPNPKFWLPISPDAIKNKSVAIRELQQFGLSAADINNLMSQPKVARMDPKTGKLEYQADSSALNADNVLATRVNGKNRYIIFNRNDPTALAMVEALKGLPVEEAGAILGLVGKATRFWSAITTQFNPIWGLFVNMPRDMLWMYSTLSSTPLMGNKWEMTKKIVPAMIGSWQALRAERSGEPVTGTWAKTFQDAANEGARTMFRDSWVNTREDGEFLKKEMAKLSRGNVTKVVAGMVNVLEDFNNMLESSIRLAAYDTAINQQKLTKEQAAKIAKEITVNFDRRGAKTLYARNLYAFFNAALQGTSKLYEVLKSPAGKGIMTSMVGIGILQAFALAMAGLGDDDVPDYEKEKNFIIPTGGKGYIKIPMMQGLSIFVNMGRLAVEMPMDVMNNKSRNMGKKVTSLLSSVGNAFNPFGESSNTLLGLAPTTFRPPLAVSVNEDAFGRKISKQEFPGKPSPGYLRSSAKATPFSTGVAQLINKLTGGSEFTKGGYSPTGDDIDYLIKQYAGGLGREITGAVKFGSALSKGEPLEVNQIPIISKYLGTSDRRGAVARNFYDNVNEIAKYNFEYKSLIDANKDARADLILRKYPEAELHNEAQGLVRSISKISKLRDQREKENAPKSELRALENEQLLLMREFNREVYRAKRR